MVPLSRARSNHSGSRIQRIPQSPARGFQADGDHPAVGCADCLESLEVKACDRRFSIECDDEETAAAVSACFDRLVVETAGPSAAGAEVKRKYHVSRASGSGGFHIHNSASAADFVDGVAALLYRLDKNVTIALQHDRSDLYFVHAAALAIDGRVVVLAAPPGTGKSTLTLALLENGFSYLSDELAPIDVEALKVHPYAHALCLKTPPPKPFKLPPDTFDAGGRFHIPVAAVPASAIAEPLSLGAVVFIERRLPAATTCRPITPARAAARLMANALNPLSHAGGGLAAAIAVSRAVPCFELETSNLNRACEEIKRLMVLDG